MEVSPTTTPVSRKPRNPSADQCKTGSVSLKDFKSTEEVVYISRAGLRTQRATAVDSPFLCRATCGIFIQMNKVLHGDCLDKLKDLKDNSVDSVVNESERFFKSIPIEEQDEIQEECSSMEEKLEKLGFEQQDLQKNANEYWNNQSVYIKS